MTYDTDYRVLSTNQRAPSIYLHAGTVHAALTLRTVELLEAVPHLVEIRRQGLDRFRFQGSLEKFGTSARRNGVELGCKIVAVF
jgi:hypothetical protein